MRHWLSQEHVYMCEYFTCGLFDSGPVYIQWRQIVHKMYVTGSSAYWQLAAIKSSHWCNKTTLWFSFLNKNDTPVSILSFWSMSNWCNTFLARKRHKMPHIQTEQLGFHAKVPLKRWLFSTVVSRLCELSVLAVIVANASGHGNALKSDSIKGEDFPFKRNDKPSVTAQTNKRWTGKPGSFFFKASWKN